MSTNRDILEGLWAEKKIPILRSAIFDQTPQPLPTDLDWDRVEGMLLGLAIGDALGAPTEGLRPRFRRRIFGEIRHYLENPHTGQRLGYPTDDTQLAFWTLEQMLADDGFVPGHVARRFCADRIFGLGNSVAGFLRRHREQGLPWYESGPPSAGNGALMRVAPMLVPHLRTASSELWVDTALSAMITHNDPASIAACVGFVRLLWEVLRMRKTPPRDWWRATWVETAAALEGETRYRSLCPRYRTYEGPVWRFVDERLQETGHRMKTLDACESWWSSAYLMETLPCVLHILARHAGNPRQAMVRAVNDTRDNDTIAAIVGAAVGALHGRTGLPKRWVDDLTGRTTTADDGRVFALIEAARIRWESPLP
ncbi:MAG: ADP-ribosylglycohydrolase [bacterium]|nr:ADP-ribosylglycohydrolase [bacterium]